MNPPTLRLALSIVEHALGGVVKAQEAANDGDAPYLVALLENAELDLRRLRRGLTFELEEAA